MKIIGTRFKYLAETSIDKREKRKKNRRLSRRQLEYSEPNEIVGLTQQLFT